MIHDVNSVSTVTLQMFFFLAVSVETVETTPAVTAHLCRCESTGGLRYASLNIFVLVARQPIVGQDLRTIEASRSHSDTPHTVGPRWTSDQSHTETST
jgi:hypothetical protein